ncbi:MAG TPA: oligosaccharide flippase family protein [Mucilaginibacter sp.]|nr:oligosaccharide flippase family protein [Mucilaginibacter sp.]
MAVTKKLINKHTLSLASNAVMPVVGMVTVGLLARNLTTPGDFSNWILFLTTFTLANLFRSGFLQTSLVKFYSGADEERARVVAGSTWYIGFLLTASLAIVSIIVFIFSSNHPTVELTAKWFTIIFFSTLPSSVALWILQAEERFDRIFLLQLMWQGCFLVLIVVLILLKKVRFPIVIIAYCSTAIITSIFAIINGWAKFRTIKYKTGECVKQLANFGKYSVGTSVSSYMLRGSDTYIINFMFTDPTVVGIYYLPQRLMEVIEIPLRSFVATALPAMSAAVNRDDKKHLTYILKKYAGILTILILPLTLGSFIFADLVIDILGGHQYAHSNASNIFRIFMCYALFMPLDRFFGITLDMLNKPHINMTKVTIMLVVNIAGDFAGIFIFHNLYGVALASIFTFLSGVLYGYWVLKKHLNFSISGIFKMGFLESKSLAVELVAKYKQRKT